MSCERFQEELLLSFGDRELTPELKEHIGGCQECATFYAELTEISDRLPADAEFYPGSGFAEEVQARVERAISVPRRKFSAQRIMAMAASLLIVATASWFGLRNGGGLQPVGPQSADTAIAGSDNLEPALDETSIDLLIENVAADPYRDGEDLLLRVISDDELDYLEQHLNVGDML